MDKFGSIICLIYFIALFTLSCCPNKNSISNRKKYAQQLVANSGFKELIIKTKNFSLFTYIHINDSSDKTINIYLEGDGLAWKNRHTISDNPTPTNPIALKMAITDKSRNVVYIARPCQYVDLGFEINCQQKFWSHSRFSKTVIDSVNEGIDKIKKHHHMKFINLYGYSGGGAIAILAAKNRSDVKSIVTIAGNLNHKELTKIHQVSPLYDSLDSIDFIEQIKTIPSYHIAGEKDEVIPSIVIRDFVYRVNALDGCAKFKEIKNASHEFSKWPEAMEEALKETETIKCKTKKLSNNGYIGILN